MCASRLLLPFLLPIFALLPAATLVGGCTEDRAPAPPRAIPADGGAPCTPGTEGCACTNTEGCDPGLLCIVRRCLATEGSRNEPDPIVRPPVIAPLPNIEDASPGTPDSGPTSSDAGG